MVPLQQVEDTDVATPNLFTMNEDIPNEHVTGEKEAMVMVMVAVVVVVAVAEDEYVDEEDVDEDVEDVDEVARVGRLLSNARGKAKLGQVVATKTNSTSSSSVSCRTTC